MNKLEAKLIELGYVCKDHFYYNYKFYVKEIVENKIFIEIKILENTIKNCYVDTISFFKIFSQQDIDNLQQAFNEMQKDLEVLKEYEE